MINKRIIIEGELVHHVGYRPFLLAGAVKLRIRCFEAENIEDVEKQKVVVSFGGDENQIREFLKFAKENYPKKAKINKIYEDTKIPEHVMSIDDYQKLLGAEQQNTMVQTGFMMLNKIDDVGNKVYNVGRKVDDVRKEVGAVGIKVDSLKDATHNDFNRMDSKYDKV